MSQLLVAVLDIETSGLNERKDVILECAFQVIDPITLAVRYEAQTLVHHVEKLEMEPPVREMHTENGLLEALAKAPLVHDGWVGEHRGLDMWLADHFHHLGAQPGSIYLAGMSIHFDRKFLQVKCPLACAFLHYRMLDLSTPRELLRMWAELGVLQLPKVEKIPHRAMDDCKLAVETLKWYQRHQFPGAAQRDVVAEAYLQLVELAAESGVPGAVSAGKVLEQLEAAFPALKG